MDFTYERSRVLPGVKIETVTGGERYKGKVWRQIATQIYCENGKDGYRELGHFASGAPFLYGTEDVISISHTDGCLVVATRKALDGEAVTPPVGVDAERADRAKAFELRERFLTPGELALLPSGTAAIEAAVIAWTCKEAMLKAGMDSGIDWHHDIIVTSLPVPVDRDAASSGRIPASAFGSGYLLLDGTRRPFRLLTLRFSPFLLTLAL